MKMEFFVFLFWLWVLFLYHVCGGGYCHIDLSLSLSSPSMIFDTGRLEMPLREALLSRPAQDARNIRTLTWLCCQ